MARAKTMIIFKDRGLSKILAKLKNSGSVGGAVGVMAPKAHETHPLRENITIGEVAIINEFGSRKADVPARSYLRSTFKENREVLQHAMAEGVAKFIEQGGGLELRGGYRVIFDHAGKVMADKVKEKIASGEVPPPDAPKTVEDKGHDRTLQNTGVLHDAIDHAIVARRNGALGYVAGPMFENDAGEGEGA